jgi:hypothetical protein
MMTYENDMICISYQNEKQKTKAKSIKNRIQ